MCGRATLRIELSTHCMMFAIIIESVIMPRLGTATNGGTASPLTADAPWAASSRQAGHHMLAASSPFPGRSGCSRYRSGIREFWQARTSEAGALSSLHVMPINAAYGRLPWDGVAEQLPFGDAASSGSVQKLHS